MQRWQPDALLPGFEALELEFPADYDGPVASTLVRLPTANAPRGAVLRADHADPARYCMISCSSCLNARQSNPDAVLELRRCVQIFDGDGLRSILYDHSS